MNAGDGRRFFRQAVFVLWGMTTLVLLFCVVLLVYEMVKRGQSPLALSENAPVRSAPSRVPGAVGTREVRLYFASRDGRVLVSEMRTIEFGENPAATYRRVLEALIAGPRDPLCPILPPESQVRAVYLLGGGELVVDLSRETALQKQQSASSEALLIYGIVNTLTQEALHGQDTAGVNRVRLLIEGSPPPETFPHHVDVSNAIASDVSWVVTGDGEPSNAG